jgi:hypothetical protein
MRSLALLAVIATLSQLAQAQGGSGAPSPVGQSPTPQAAIAAERAVQARHDKVAALAKARAARRARRVASGNGR